MAGRRWFDELRRPPRFHGGRGIETFEVSSYENERGDTLRHIPSIEKLSEHVYTPLSLRIFTDSLYKFLQALLEDPKKIDIFASRLLL
jgi:hypothetical protein